MLNLGAIEQHLGHYDESKEYFGHHNMHATAVSHLRTALWHIRELEKEIAKKDAEIATIKVALADSFLAKRN